MTYGTVRGMAKVQEMITSGQIAEMLGVSRARVHQLSDRPDFPPPSGRAGNYRLWDRAVIERWAASWDRSNPGGRPKINV